MLEHKGATIEGLNSYISKLKEAQGDTRLTCIQFDAPYREGMHLEKMFVAKPVAEVERFTSADYSPRGGTPLLDAIGTTIHAIEESIGSRDVNVILTIQTDGEERDSVEYSWEAVRSLIADQEARGWQFNFLGAGMNSYAEGQKMGLKKAQILSYSTDIVSTRSAFESTAAMATAYSSGSIQTMNFSENMKMAAGDKWQDRLDG